MDGHQANGAFVAAGPPGFTALALIKLGQYAKDMYAHNDYTSNNNIADFLSAWKNKKAYYKVQERFGTLPAFLLVSSCTA